MIRNVDSGLQTSCREPNRDATSETAMDVQVDPGVHTSMNTPVCYSCTLNEAKSTPQMLKNRAIRCMDGNKYVEGTVSEYDVGRKKYRIVYDDGDEQELTLREVWKYLIPL